MARNKSEEVLKLQARVMQLENLALRPEVPISPEAVSSVVLIRLVEEARALAVIHRARVADLLPPPVGDEFWETNRFPWEDAQDEDC